MDEMRAAIGLVQLDKLPAGNARRKDLTDRYRRNLSGSRILMPFASLPSGSESVYHILPVLLPEGCDRKAVIESLKAKGIQSTTRPFGASRHIQENSPLRVPQLLLQFASGS
jgi:dTDP-4-amino-4,6-dideoxygalactose transaminase